MKTLFLLGVAVCLLSSCAFAQCPANPNGQGTLCRGPLQVDDPTYPTTVWSFVPETTQFACLPGSPTIWNFCGRNGELQIDYGQGYVSLKGKDGVSGINGTNGKDGLNGANGTNGINGTNGKDGANGTNGLNGRDGSAGATGPQGLQGNPGVDSFTIGSSITVVVTGCNMVGAGRTCVLKRVK